MIEKSAKLFLLWIVVLFVSTSSSAQVKISSGLVSGTSTSDGVIRIFKGIPFADPPTGDLRWKDPQPVSPWKGVRACTNFGPSPMQATPERFSMWTEEYLIPKEPIGEDCLYLNVWTPAKTAKEKKPVLVWIYGGGFQSGGSAVPIYDGEAFARRGVVFVSINYRVGIFGFFSHPDLSKESPHASSGNYGLLDQIAALKWVQQNIATFGGDPTNVTIAGQSAGSMSVNCLVASPLGKGLFKKAIAHSGAFLVSNPIRGASSLKQAEADGEKLLKSINLSSLSDLRKLPADELFKKTPGASRGPIVDGYVLPESISSIFAKGKENKVSLLTGWNQDEGFLFGPVKNAEDFKKELTTNFGETESKNLLKYYPANSDAEAASSQLNLSRDQIFGVQNYTWATIQSTHGSKVYVYRFTRKVPAVGEYVKYGAFHTGEVPYAYDNLKFVDRPWEKLDHQLANTMASYWTNFIKTGNPNGAGLPQWSEFSEKKKQVMMLGLETLSKEMEDGSSLDYLRTLLSR